MYQVKVRRRFAAAHFLSRYHGKCENLHGHNYEVWVHAAGAALDEGGMLVDFGELKFSLSLILQELDHSLLNDHPFFKDGDPSAERIALFIYTEMHKKLPEINITRVDVAETENNIASYLPDQIDPNGKGGEITYP